MSELIINSIVQNFLINRDPKEYLNVIDELQAAYVVSEEYTCLPADERKSTINSIKELRDLIVSLMDQKQDVSYQKAEPDSECNKTV